MSTEGQIIFALIVFFFLVLMNRKMIPIIRFLKERHPMRLTMS